MPQTTMYLESINISISELNITSANLDDFLQKLLQFNNNISNINLTIETNKLPAHHETCNQYCKGFSRNILLQYKEIHGYISLLLCIFGTIANILNIFILTRKELAKSPINKILKWLSVTDMFVLIEYIPFTIYMYISASDKHYFSYHWATYLLFHMHFTQIMHTISILLTVLLAFWRFVAIKYSHGRLLFFFLSNCNRIIFMAFIIAPILCFPTYFLFKVKHVSLTQNKKKTEYVVDADEDTFLYSLNFWIHSVVIKLLPCLFLTIISYFLIRILYKASKRRIQLKRPANITSSSSVRKSTFCDRRSDRTTTLLVAVLCLFLMTEFPQGVLGLLSGILQKCFFIRCYILFGEIMDLLALINASIGFVLYGLMSKQFRTNFKLLFFQRNSHINEITIGGTGGNATTCV